MTYSRIVKRVSNNENYVGTGLSCDNVDLHCKNENRGINPLLQLGREIIFDTL